MATTSPTHQRTSARGIFLRALGDSTLLRGLLTQFASQPTLVSVQMSEQTPQEQNLTTAYASKPDETPYGEADKVARALRRVSRITRLPPETCIKMLERAKNCDIPDLAPGELQWRETIGRRACRHIMNGIEPSHWHGPEFQAFRKILDLLTITDTAKPNQLWKATTTLLGKAARGEPFTGLETRLVANGLDGSSYYWSLNDLTDGKERANLILESCQMAVDAWPAYYRTAHPGRLEAIREVAQKDLTEMQCELIYTVAMSETSDG